MIGMMWIGCGFILLGFHRTEPEIWRKPEETQWPCP